MGRVVRHILIAEDDVRQGAGLARFLALSGHDVRIARDGRQAEDILRDYEPDVMILDLNLPEVDGWTLARRVRSNPEYTKRPLLIAVSGYNTEGHRERSREAGFDYHLGKPVAPPVLLDLIERAVEDALAAAAWLTN
jgi:CheY-like chemotaxis protein